MLAKQIIAIEPGVVTGNFAVEDFLQLPQNLRGSLTRLIRVFLVIRKKQYPAVNRLGEGVGAGAHATPRGRLPSGGLMAGCVIEEVAHLASAGGLVPEERSEVEPIGFAVELQTGQSGQGDRQVHEIDHLATDPALDVPIRPGYEERYADRLFVGQLFAEKSMTAEHVSVIAGIYQNGVGQLICGFQSLNKASELVIQRGDVGVVSTQCLAQCLAAGNRFSIPDFVGNIRTELRTNRVITSKPLGGNIPIGIVWRSP